MGWIYTPPKERYTRTWIVHLCFPACSLDIHEIKSTETRDFIEIAVISFFAHYV